MGRPVRLELFTVVARLFVACCFPVCWPTHRLLVWFRRDTTERDKDLDALQADIGNLLQFLSIDSSGNSNAFPSSCSPLTCRCVFQIWRVAPLLPLLQPIQPLRQRAMAANTATMRTANLLLLLQLQRIQRIQRIQFMGVPIRMGMLTRTRRICITWLRLANTSDRLRDKRASTRKASVFAVSIL